MTEAEARAGVVGASVRLLGSLPGQFLALVLMNLLFILGLFWFMNELNQTRERLLAPILSSCLQLEKGQK